LGGFSVSIGLVHLFWGNHVKIPCNLFYKYNQIQIHDFAQIFNQLKRGSFIPLNQDQKAFFQSLSIHKTLLHHLAKNNSYSSSRSLSSSPRSIKSHPSHHIVSCLSHISLQTPPDNNFSSVPDNCQQFSPSHIAQSLTSSNQNIDSNKLLIMDQDSPQRDCIFQTENDLHSSPSVQSNSDQCSENERLKENIHDLNKENQSYLNKITLLEFEMKEFKSVQDSSCLNSKIKIEEEFHKMLSHMNEVNQRIILIDKENKEILSHFQSFMQYLNLFDQSNMEDTKEITSNSHIQFLNLKQNYEDKIKIIGIENNSLKEESSILKKQNQDLFQQLKN
jgi:hypothetical protein